MARPRNKTPKPKPAKTTLYFSDDDIERVRALQGKRVMIKRDDPYGNSYYQEIPMPERPVQAARAGFRLLLDLAEGTAKAQHDQEE